MARPAGDLWSPNHLLQSLHSVVVGGRLERGLENPTVAVLERMAEALGTQIVEFFATPQRGEPLPQPLRGGRRAKL